MMHVPLMLGQVIFTYFLCCYIHCVMLQTDLVFWANPGQAAEYIFKLECMFMIAQGIWLC